MRVVQRAHARAVLWVALVVAAAAVDGEAVGERVDVVHRHFERGQAAGDVGLAQAVRRCGQVTGDAEPAEALPEHAPALDPELGPDELGVGHDAVGAEVRQVRRLLRRREIGKKPHGARTAGAALVEHEHAEVAQRPDHPPRAPRGARGSRGLEPGAALEEDQERLVAAVGLGHLAREHRELVALGPRVVERHRELVLGQDQPGDAVGHGHRRRPRMAKRRPAPISAARG